MNPAGIIMSKDNNSIIRLSHVLFFFRFPSPYCIDFFVFATEFFVCFALKRGLGITRINANAHDAFLDQRMRILGSCNVVCPITANHQSPRVALQNTVRALKHISWPISWLLNHVAAQGHGKIQLVQQLGNHLDKVSDRTNFAELSYTR